MTARTSWNRFLVLCTFFAPLAVSTQVVAADYANSQLLVETQQLEALLDEADVRIIDVRSKEAYDQGHIPNAVHLGADDVIDPNSHVAGDLLPHHELAALLGQRGVGKDTRVVLYDDNGGFHASRLFWMLEYFGHGKVALLNGGIPKWQQEGRVVTTDVPKVRQADFALTYMPRRLATADWLLDRRDESSVVVIDVRPAKLYDAGHIPWAQNIGWKENLTADSTLKPADELLEKFAAQGVTPDKNVAVHCQNGMAAAHSYFTLRLLGYPRVRSYDRSWSEWGAADDLPKSGGTKG